MVIDRRYSTYQNGELRSSWKLSRFGRLQFICPFTAGFRLNDERRPAEFPAKSVEGPEHGRLADQLALEFALSGKIQIGRAHV